MKKLPRVLFINHSIRDGGPGRSLFYILKYIDRTKVDPWVLVPKEDVFNDMIRKEGLGDKIIIDERFPENILRPRFGIHSSLSNGILSSLVSKVSKVASVTLNVFDLISLVLSSPSFVREKQVDIIYCNGTLAKIVGALMGAISRRPVIWHVRNIQQAKIMQLTMSWLASLSSVKKIICVSGATAAQFTSGQEKITVIHNGIDTQDFNPGTAVGTLRAEYNLSPDTVIIGNTGRIVKRKGYELFIKAAKVVQERLGEGIAKVRFVVVGDTPYFFSYNHLDTLKALVKEQGLEEVFIFTGYKKDVGQSLKDFDIFVIPSSYPDPFPRSVIEAMSFSLPVIGFKVGGIVESVESGVTGILSEQGDFQSIGESMLKLIQDKPLRLSMGSAGRKRVSEIFSAKDRTKDVERNILEVAEK